MSLLLRDQANSAGVRVAIMPAVRGARSYDQRMRPAQVRPPRSHAVLLGIFALALGGCGTSSAIRQGNEVAEVGKAYASSMIALADYALEKHLTFAYNDLVKRRIPEYQRADQLTQELDKVTENARQFARLIAAYKEHTRRLEEYFVALNDLVDTNVKEPAEAAMKEATAGLNAFGKGLGSSIKVTDDQITAAGSLAGVAITAIHGNRVQQILERDGPLIARHISLQREALSYFEGKIASLARLDELALYRDELRSAYSKDFGTTSKAALPPDFQSKWVAVVKEGGLGEQLRNAKAAAQKLQQTWIGILEGKQQPTDLLADVALIKAAADQARAAHEARHKPGA